MRKQYNIKYSDAQVQTVLNLPQTNIIRGYFNNTKEVKLCTSQFVSKIV